MARLVRGSRLAALAVLAVLALGFSPSAFVGPAASTQQVARASRVGMSFFGSEPPPPPKKKDELPFPFSFLEAINNYASRGSGSLNGPMAGFPFVTTLFLSLLGAFIYICFDEGSKPIIRGGKVM
mmetsp:Transcript_96453/g.277033  ORF Transcript_96453/g.277033 Transcript_96453/m.277033 type:complete len:125 (+) Transcript_96453:78-452(+)